MDSGFTAFYLLGLIVDPLLRGVHGTRQLRPLHKTRMILVDQLKQRIGFADGAGFPKLSELPHKLLLGAGPVKGHAHRDETGNHYTRDNTQSHVAA